MSHEALSGHTCNLLSFLMLFYFMLLGVLCLCFGFV